MRFFKLLLMGSICMLVCHSCSTCSRKQPADIIIDLADWAIDSTYANMARKAYYALPTPIEMSMLLKSSGIGWQPDLLSNPADAAKHLTHRKMALNFGVYVTDLTYAGLFEQSQTVLRYKRAIEILTDGMGLQSAVDFNTLQQLEANANDKDAVLRIVAETYASCTASLNESDRYSLTLAMITGGWIEGMYIATSMTTLYDSRTKQLIIDQKLTFDMMWMVMSDLNHIPDVAGMMNDLSELAQLLDKVDVDNVTLEEYVKIKEQIRILRQNIINL